MRDIQGFYGGWDARFHGDCLLRRDVREALSKFSSVDRIFGHPVPYRLVPTTRPAAGHESRFPERSALTGARAWAFDDFRLDSRAFGAEAPQTEHERDDGDEREQR